MNKLYLKNFLFSSMMVVAACAHAETVVIVSAQSKADTSISADDVKRIFLVKIRNFPNGASAVPLDLPESTVRDDFYQKLTGKGPIQVKAYWAEKVFSGAAAPPKKVETPEQLIELVSNDTTFIGYVDKSKINDKVKVIYSLP